MGEACPKSENPAKLKFETHFLSCICVAGFGDKCQDVACDLCGVRSVVREGEVLSQGFREILVLDVTEMFIEPYIEG